jgi:hypothetical protein
VKPSILLKEAARGKRALLFIDSAHFIHAVFLGMLWCLMRVFIKSASGRSRFNVLGAIDITTYQLFTICNTAYINAGCICEMLKQLSSYYAGLPVTIILDNARYQKCQMVFKCAADLGIELLYLPPYSPNLNLIERLWRYVKQEVLYCKYYESFADFKGAIETCLNEVNGAKRSSIVSLLSPQFHLLEKEVNLAA